MPPAKINLNPKPKRSKMKRKMYKRVHCKDGFSMSVQASQSAYCTPRSDTATYYTEVEVGYPNRMEPLLSEYCEDPTRPCDTVYGYVPANVVSLIITKHGGLVNGTVPNGVLLYDGPSQAIIGKP